MSTCMPRIFIYRRLPHWRIRSMSRDSMSDSLLRTGSERSGVLRHHKLTAVRGPCIITVINAATGCGTGSNLQGRCVAYQVPVCHQSLRNLAALAKLRILTNYILEKEYPP
jgi:hypothetical protein